MSHDQLSHHLAAECAHGWSSDHMFCAADMRHYSHVEDARTAEDWMHGLIVEAMRNLSADATAEDLANQLRPWLEGHRNHGES